MESKGSHRLLHNLTYMHWKPSACIGLQVGMVPKLYHYNAGKKSAVKKKSESKKVCQLQMYKAVTQDKILTM
jgi:hypothetical protein